MPSPCVCRAARRGPRRGRDRRRLVYRGDGIIGTLIAGWDGWRCHLYRLAVAPDRRRRGVGRALLDAAERRFVAFGGRRCDAMVLDENVEAHALYRAAGYRIQPEWSRWIRALRPPPAGAATPVATRRPPAGTAR